MAGKMMVIGLGSLGYSILQLMGRVPGIGKIVVADIDQGNGPTKTRNVSYGTAIQGIYPEIRFVHLDLKDIDRTVEVLNEERPTVICNATSLMSWWVRHTLSVETYKAVEEAGSGPWIPMHLTLTYNLMKAIKLSGINTHVVNCSYPDAVNPILDKVGLAPTIGGGNIGLLVPPVQWVVAKEFKVPIHSVRILFIGFHSVVTTKMRAPFWVKILVDDKDVTKFFHKEKLRNLVNRTPGRVISQARWTGPPNQMVTASSFLKNILAIYFDTREIINAPGPQGLLGGYPVRLSSAGAEVYIPKEITLQKAININEKGAKFDGIDRIKDDGTVVLTEKAYQIMLDNLGYECKEFKIDESANRAEELLSLIKTR